MYYVAHVSMRDIANTFRVRYVEVRFGQESRHICMAELGKTSLMVRLVVTVLTG